MSIRYLLVDTDGTVTATESDLDVKDVQKVFDGDFEVLPQPTDIDILLLASAEAKHRGENANWAATRLIRSRLRPDAFIAGKIIVTGPPNNIGEPTDVSEEVEKAVREKVAS